MKIEYYKRQVDKYRRQEGLRKSHFKTKLAYLSIHVWSVIFIILIFDLLTVDRFDHHFYA